MSASRMRVIGPGRAGGALTLALVERGWDAAPPLGRGDPVADAAQDVDLLVIATPDAAIADVAAAVDPSPHAVVMHLAGSLGLGALDPHLRRAAIHPLVALPDAPTGAQRLVGGRWFAVAGDPLANELVDQLGGHPFAIADEQRVLYHAAAVVASNHLVVLLGQVDRLASDAGVPFEAFIDLVRSSVDNVAELGPAAALTGPAARGDQITIDRHLAAIDPAEWDLYEALVTAARRLVR